jgi:hypothetical protein
MAEGVSGAFELKPRCRVGRQVGEGGGASPGWLGRWDGGRHRRWRPSRGCPGARLVDRRRGRRAGRRSRGGGFRAGRRRRRRRGGRPVVRARIGRRARGRAVAVGGPANRHRGAAGRGALRGVRGLRCRRRGSRRPSGYQLDAPAARSPGVPARSAGARSAGAPSLRAGSVRAGSTRPGTAQAWAGWAQQGRARGRGRPRRRGGKNGGRRGHRPPGVGEGGQPHQAPGNSEPSESADRGGSTHRQVLGSTRILLSHRPAKPPIEEVGKSGADEGNPRCVVATGEIGPGPPACSWGHERG